MAGSAFFSGGASFFLACGFSVALGTLAATGGAGFGAEGGGGGAFSTVFGGADGGGGMFLATATGGRTGGGGNSGNCTGSGATGGGFSRRCRFRSERMAR